jgi:hypothetical protein
MKNKHIALVVAAGLVLAASVKIPVSACGLVSETTLRRAVSEDANASASAIVALRNLGPAGLQALLDANSGTMRQYEEGLSKSWSPEQQAAWQRLEAALTAVGAQRDCQASRLYWYTDFDQAKQAAKAGGKPILSLRLLGKLDEEYSCANSRFFRTTLYANAQVSQFLRDHFILHWKSVRPVPRITVDFGDGRKIERTITGNSIHYILDADGRPIDALPGLYGPKAFLKGLADAEKAALQSAALAGDAKDQYLRQYHNERYAALLQNWNSDLSAIGNAAAKSFQAADDTTWTRIANLHAGDAQLDAASKTLIQFKNPTAVAAMRPTFSKTVVERPLVREMRNLQRSIAEDTVRNEYVLHSQIHQWLGDTSAPQQRIDELNSRVYANLFLTPDSDPWLGLAPADTFTGLKDEGLVQATSPR